jgi:hypothetical protein
MDVREQSFQRHKPRFAPRHVPTQMTGSIVVLRQFGLSDKPASWRSQSVGYGADYRPS